MVCVPAGGKASSSTSAASKEAGSKKEGKQNGQQSSSGTATTAETKVHKSYSKSDSGVGGPPAAKRPKVRKKKKSW